MQDHPIPGLAMPPSTSSVYFRPDGLTTDAFGSPLYFNPRTSTYQAFTALAVDAKELRRWKMQSMWDRHRRGATSTTAQNPSHVWLEEVVRGVRGCSLHPNLRRLSKSLAILLLYLAIILPSLFPFTTLTLSSQLQQSLIVAGSYLGPVCICLYSSTHFYSFLDLSYSQIGDSRDRSI